MPPLLRITQHLEDENRYRVELAYTDPEGESFSAVSRFTYQMTGQDRSDLRWYLEDFLLYPMDPAPQVAARVEGRLVELGVELFRQVFASEAARDLWATLRRRLDDTRVEVVTDVPGDAALPWELLCDPRSDAPLALRAHAFVRSYTHSPDRVHPAQPAEKVRILLVICRPGGGVDVPFRSVAGRLFQGLDEAARARFELEVLRPPTFASLAARLRAAKQRGEPYHIVHFDGHGAYFEPQQPMSGQGVLRQHGPYLLGDRRSGSHGYLLFENPDLDDHTEFVDGPTLGKLLVETDVPVLALNACRSAHAGLLTAPQAGEQGEQVRAFGSLALEVMDAGCAGVVAMRYNVYVVTAAQFVADLYAALAAGQTLGEAVTLGRKQLAAKPLREIAFEPRPLHDWSVPVVYEARPVRLFPPRERDESQATAGLTIDLSQAPRLEDGLPRPDAGFFGRDETLLALDRAFDRHKVVLLHAYAGSGKTMTAAEFARWYLQTGGLGGPVLFTSFEDKQTARPLDDFIRVFGPALERSGVQWNALTESQQKQVVMQALQQIPVLWIWDNVEPVAGFPRGAPSAWSEPEQRELKNFLQIMGEGTRAKFLLTSRRDEDEWLGELPRRVALPPMPLQEQVLLAQALAEKRGATLRAVDDWRPLLEYTQGNPLTLTQLVGQALRDGLKTREQVEAYVQRLRRGEAAFDDDAREGRSKSLGASLSYGFEAAFNDDERKILALLHFFQGFVDVDALVWMGNPEEEWGLPELRNVTRDTGTRLLDRAAEIGLLEAHGGGYYRIHPALPWFFGELFEKAYGAEGSEGSLRPARAFVEAMGELGNYYHNQYGAGNRDVIAALRAEEANLLHARALARQNGWWRRVISAMQGLDILYGHSGQRAAWRRLVDEIVPDFVDPATDGPLPGREAQWSLVTGYRVLWAEEERRWAEAERLQRARVEWCRERATGALEVPPEELTAGEKHALRTLAVSLEQLGHIQRESDDPECVNAYNEAVSLYQRIGDRPAEATAAFNLGHAYKDLPRLRDLAQAEGWYRRSLELREEGDRLGRGKCYSQLGSVAYERFLDARQAQAAESVLREHLNAAAGFYRQALELTPPDAVNALAVAHNQLGNTYLVAGDLERALYHYNQDIHYDEIAGNQYGAGQTRFNVALALRDAGRLDDALLYARAALRNHEPFGSRAAEDIQKAQRLIALIEQAIAKARGGG